MAASEHLILGDLLRSVSRAFYTSLYILPPGCRRPISLGYLLARTADTLADSALRGEAQGLLVRRQALEQLQSCLKNSAESLSPELLAQFQPLSAGEQKLLQVLSQSLQLYWNTSADDRESVARIVSTLIDGMLEDLSHFPDNQLRALSSQQDLDRHTFMAAGCVGGFWTEILLRHTPAMAKLSLAAKDVLLHKGTNLGKALQLTNVLRDLPADLSEGRCYLPKQELESVGLQPSDLLSPNCWPRLQPVYQQWMNQALTYYRDGLDYLRTIPRQEIRLRLSVAWPMLIGLATLLKVSQHNPLLPQRLKITRAAVYRILLLSLPSIWSNRLMAGWIESWLEQVSRSLRAPLKEEH